MEPLLEELQVSFLFLLFAFFFYKIQTKKIAARDNSACGVGTAYRSWLSAIRLISRASTDVQEGLIVFSVLFC
jgi:hypothetical protein